MQYSVYNNETLLTFNRINANNYSEMEDVPYLSGPSQTVFLYSITSDNHPLVYNQMSSLDKVTEPIKLYVQGPTTGIYSLQFNGANSIDPHCR